LARLASRQLERKLHIHCSTVYAALLKEDFMDLRSEFRDSQNFSRPDLSINADNWFQTFFKELPQDTQTCIQNCLQCSMVCGQTIQHCLRLGGEHASLEHIRLLKDCSEICRAASQLMMRESHFHFKVCEACAEICQACASDCERIGLQDELMKFCADVCLKCAESCQDMSLKH
jgi:hypothetical protein